MKRLLLSIFTLICANTLLAQERFSIGELTYEITNETQAQVELHKCSNSAISVIIPQEVSYNGVNYSITAIGADAFKFCFNLASVNIPNSVTSIGDCAFLGCCNLTIYAEAQKRPKGWIQPLLSAEKSWNPDKRPVVWGYKNNG
jgi:hypothetical protein